MNESTLPSAVSAPTLGKNTINTNKQYKTLPKKPERIQTRHQYGKTDTVDAITAARSVLAGTATVIPKTHDGNVEMIRQLQIVRDNIVKNMTEITNIFHDTIMSAP